MAFLSTEDVVDLHGHARLVMVEDPGAFVPLGQIDKMLSIFERIGWNPRGVRTRDFDWAAFRSVYGPEIQVAPVGDLYAVKHRRTGKGESGIKADDNDHWETAGILISLAE